MNPLIPSFSPSGGEGARRTVEREWHRFMAPIGVQELEVVASNEQFVWRSAWPETNVATDILPRGKLECTELASSRGFGSRTKV